MRVWNVSSWKVLATNQSPFGWINRSCVTLPGLLGGQVNNLGRVGSVDVISHGGSANMTAGTGKKAIVDVKKNQQNGYNTRKSQSAVARKVLPAHQKKTIIA